MDIVVRHCCHVLIYYAMLNHCCSMLNHCWHSSLYVILPVLLLFYAQQSIIAVHHQSTTSAKQILNHLHQQSLFLYKAITRHTSLPKHAYHLAIDHSSVPHHQSVIPVLTAVAHPHVIVAIFDVYHTAALLDDALHACLVVCGVAEYGDAFLGDGCGGCHCLLVLVAVLWDVLRYGLNRCCGGMVEE